MSVDQAVLFYSRHNAKSMKLKRWIDESNVDINLVCVDPEDIREHLLKDKKYRIQVVPSVLTIYESGEYLVITGKDLENWFENLIENMRLYEESLLQTELVPQSQPEPQPLYTEQNSITTPLSMPGSAPANQDLSEIPETSKVKEIKDKKINPGDVLAEMQRQREEYDEKIAQERPFGI